MGQLRKIKETIRNEFLIPEQLIKEIPSVMQKSLEKFKPSTFDLKSTIQNFHSDNRNLVTSGAYVPIPFILMMLPIFTGGKVTDSREHLDRTLNISGSKSGIMKVTGESLSSDLCFYVFAFLMQMAIYHNTTLLHISNNYIMEFLGWKNTAINHEKLNTILEKLYSIEFGGTYGGLFKNKNNKKEERYNIFSGRLIEGYYMEKAGCILNLSPTILNLFALEKVWHGINLENYSKIPTGHCKTLFTYIGAKSRGSNSITVQARELFERLSLESIATSKQKIKIIKESLDILKELKIINDYTIVGHFIEQKTITIVISKNKQKNRSFFDLEHLEKYKSYNSIDCHEHHNLMKTFNGDIQTIHSKILRIFNFKEFVDNYNAETLSLKLKKDNYGFLKNIYDDNRKVQSELIKIESQQTIKEWLKEGEISNTKDINRQIVFNKVKNSDTFKNNVEILNSSGSNLYTKVINDAKDFLNEQTSNFNKQEKLVHSFLLRQTESTSALAENIKDKLNNSDIDSNIKVGIYELLFNYIDNISVGLVHDLKESKIPHQIYDDGTLKIKTINDNNFKKLTLNTDLRELLKTVEKEKIIFLDNELAKGQISEYDYKNKSNSNKLYYSTENTDGKELVEGHKIFWWQEKIDSKLNRTHRYSNYDNADYNHNVQKYRINDIEHHKALISTFIKKEHELNIREENYKNSLLALYIDKIVKEKDNEIILYEKVAVYSIENKEIYFANNDSFKKFLASHNLKLELKLQDENIKIFLQETLYDCKKIRLSDCLKDDNMNYKKEYIKMQSLAQLRIEESEQDDNYLNLPIFTLKESKKLNEIEAKQKQHLLLIEQENEKTNITTISHSNKIDVYDLIDIDNIF